MLHVLCQRPHTQVWNSYSVLSLDMSKQVFLPVLQQNYPQSTFCHGVVLLYSLPQNPVLLPNCSGQTPELHSQLKCFQTLNSTSTSTGWMMKISITCQRELCVTPHIGCQFMSWYFNVHAQGIANYK